MTARTLRRWCEPEVILIVANLFDEQALMFHAIRQARKNGAKLLLVHASRPAAFSFHSGRKLPPASSSPDIQEELDRMARQLRWEGLSCETFVLTGHPAEEISSLVKSRRVDRVLMASRRHKRFERSSTESLIEELLPALDVPLCVIGEKVPAGSNADRPTGRISLALSLSSENSENCLNFACRFAQGNHAHLTVLHVFGGARKHVLSDERNPLAVAARIPTPALREAGLFCPLEIAAREGNPAKEILKYDSMIPQDFIILGAPQNNSGARRESANVLRNVIAEARCPVLILRLPTAMTNHFPLATHDLKAASYGW